MNRSPGWLQALLIAAFVVVLHLSLGSRVADLDSFYHIGHTASYLEGSFFDTALPWATQSVIADQGADLWWGFHVLLAPFAAVSDPAVGIHLAGIVLTLLMVGGVGFLFARHGVEPRAAWVALFLVAVPNVLFRYLMVRPHVISLALSLLLLSFLVRGRWWQALLASLAITWIHLSLFWMPLGIVAAYALTRLVVSGEEGVPMLRAAPAVLAGVALGAVLRPQPLASLRLAWIQIGELFAIKGADTPLLFAGELVPLPLLDLLQTSWLFLAAWLVCVALTVRLAIRDRLEGVPAQARGLLVGSILISSVFLALSVVSARRALVEWVAFGFIPLPVIWTWAVPEEKRRRVLLVGLALLAVHLPWSVHRHRLNVQFAAFPANTLTEVAEWLEQNTEPDEIVFHARWDNFGPLVARNRHNRYLSGMDPVFQFIHDPKLYWEFFWLSSDIHDEWTCDAFPCFDGEATDTHEVIWAHFGARWALVEPTRNPKLTLFFLNDDRFELALETQHEAVFRLVEPVDPDVVPEPGQ